MEPMLTIRPNFAARMPSKVSLQRLKQEPRLVSITASHMSRVMLGHRAVAGDAGVVDQDLDRRRVRLDLLHRRLARLEIAGVELDGRDPGLFAEASAARVVAERSWRRPCGRPPCSAMLIASPMPRVPPVTRATRAMIFLLGSGWLPGSVQTAPSDILAPDCRESNVEEHGRARFRQEHDRRRPSAPDTWRHPCPRRYIAWPIPYGHRAAPSRAAA